MKIFVIGSEELVAAFALGGMEGKAVSDRRSAREAFEEDFRRNGMGILVVEERVAEMARKRLDLLKLDPAAPLVVEVPGFSGPMEERRTPLDMVRQALGIKI